MKLVKPVEVVSHVYQISTLGARVTVVHGDEGVVLVDAGGRGSLRLIAAGLGVLGSSLQRVRLVVLTHYHPDHTGGLAPLVEATGAKVAAHRREAGIISGQEAVPSPFHSSLLTKVTRPFLPSFYGDSAKVDYALEDGDTLPGHDDVSVIHTPGHTQGSICLYLTSKKVLIVGDALQYRFGRLGLPAAAVTQDKDQARESLKKLLPLDFQVICFGHFSPLRGDAKVALQRLLQDTSVPSNKFGGL